MVVMTRSDHFKINRRERACRFCRVSQVDGPRGSAGAAAPDSDGKGGMPNERIW